VVDPFLVEPSSVAFSTGRRSGGRPRRPSVATGIVLILLAMTIQSLPAIVSALRRFPHGFDFRTRTSLYLTAVVILPLIVFVIFVRAYLANRLAPEYEDRARMALTSAQRVIMDYLASTNTARPEQILDDDVLSWLSLVIVLMAAFIVVLDTTVLNVSIPTIIRELDSTIGAVE
jgi:hypothetical protein